MTIRVNKTTISSWTERWSGKEFILGGPSPFGTTESGATDYRGVSFEDKRLANLVIDDADFSAADLHDLRIENCSFLNCTFDRAALTQVVTKKSRFDQCRFRKADLRAAQIGYGGTDFYRCEFDGIKVTRAGFLNAIFTEIDFDGKNWSHTDFGASGFWNCTFRGVLSDITFRGDYLIQSQREIAGRPERTGLHNVSFENAQLNWVGFYNGCELENITLPSEGSAFLCNVKDLIMLYADFDQKSNEYEVFTKYLRIIRPSFTEQSEKIISRNDLIKVGGDQIGRMLYTCLKSRLR